MGDQQHRGAQLAREMLEVIEHLALHGDVQRRGRLVGDQQPRPASQPDGDQSALAHTAGKLMGILPGPQAGLGHPRVGEQLDHLLPGRFDIVGAQCFSDLEAHLPYRVQIGHRVLRHVADTGASDGPELAPVSGRELNAVKVDAAGRDSSAGRQQTKNRRSGGGLSRAGFPDDRHALPGTHLEIHPPHRRNIVTEPHLEAGDAQQR